MYCCGILSRSLPGTLEKGAWTVGQCWSNLSPTLSHSQRDLKALASPHSFVIATLHTFHPSSLHAHVRTRDQVLDSLQQRYCIYTEHPAPFFPASAQPRISSMQTLQDKYCIHLECTATGQRLCSHRPHLATVLPACIGTRILTLNSAEEPPPPLAASFEFVVLCGLPFLIAVVIAE